MSSETVPISVAVPAYRRSAQLRTTLERLLACHPMPAEILVHLDGNDCSLRALVEHRFPDVRILSSEDLSGPGGARNLMMKEARCSWVAHFDDDSFPQDLDYFAKAWSLIEELPQTAVFCACILPDEIVDPPGLWLQAFYPGCGHLMNRDWFLRTRGYLPLPIAYNLEEVDVSIQLNDIGGQILQTGQLRVYHDHPTPEREDETTQTAMMINTVLFPLLRYPVVFWPQALGSILRRLLGLALQGEWGVIRGAMWSLPDAVVRYLPLRFPVSIFTTFQWLLLRRNPERVNIVNVR